LDEKDAVETLKQYDVGIIPYQYEYPYNHCSPNKLGQYFAAGLAIYANHQHFVTSIIQESGAGETFTWQSREAFTSGLKKYLDQGKLAEYKEASMKYFYSYANFDIAFNSIAFQTKPRKFFFKIRIINLILLNSKKRSMMTMEHEPLFIYLENKIDI